MSDIQFSPEKLRGLELPLQRVQCIVNATASVAETRSRRLGIAKDAYVDEALLQTQPIIEELAPLQNTMTFMPDEVKTAKEAVAAAFVKNPNA